jgi:hypothetical protein
MKVTKSSLLWDMMPSSPSKVNRLSKENVASVFRVEELAKQESSAKQAADVG